MKNTLILLLVAATALFTAVSAQQPLDFSYTQNTFCPQFNVTFDIWDSDTLVDYYKIDFGDGTPEQTFLDTIISHNYTSGGTFFSLLRSYDSFDNQRFGASILVYLSGPGISFTTLSACPGDNIFAIATDEEGDMGISQWDLGDGTVISPAEWFVLHAYDNAGIYNISLSVNDPQCGSVTVYRKFTISDSYSITSIGMDIKPDTVCPGDKLGVTVFGAGGTFNWDFGDGKYMTNYIPSANYKYADTGTYIIAVEVTNGCGSVANVFDTVFISGSLDIDITDFYDPEILPNPVCPGDQVMFNCWDCPTYAMYIWDYQDGSADTNNSYVTHSFTSIGTKYPELTLINGCGSETTLVYTLSVQNNVALDTNNFFYVFLPDSACAGDEVIGLVNNGASGYQWDFGDGNTATVPDFEDPVTVAFFHAYTNTGLYQTELTITNGCGNSETVTIPVYIGANVPVQDVNLGDGPTGFVVTDAEKEGGYATCTSIELVGFGGSSYVWDFGDGTTLNTTSDFITHVWDSAGTYTITLLTTNSCGNSATFYMDIKISGECKYSCPFSVNVSTANATCGNADGSATAIAAGGVAPYTYSWSNSATGATATGLAADFYAVGVTDSLGCTVYTGADVSNTGITLDAAVSDASCNDGNDGSIDISITGGTEPYTFEWSNGVNTEDISGISAGVYDLIVYDSGMPEACIATESITVNEPDKLNVYVLTNNSSCQGNDGNAMVLATGGTEPYTYAWSTGETDESANNLPAAIYRITVTDDNNCATVKEFSINSVDGPSVAASSVTDVTCASPNTGAINISVSGGTAPYSFYWSTTASTQNITGLSVGFYYVTVTDDSGCVAAISVEVEKVPPPNPGICMVTVDTSGKNLVIWEEVPDAVSYNIYKEGAVANVFNKVGTVLQSTDSEFHDSTANPLLRPWRYKLSSVDACGSESSLSTYHQTMHLLTNLGINDEVNLIWDGYEGFSFGTYRIFRGTSAQNMVKIDSVPSNIFTYADYTHPGGLLFYSVEVVRTSPCVVNAKIKTYNASKSNTASQVAPVGMEEMWIGDCQNCGLRIVPNPNNGRFTLSTNNESFANQRIYELRIMNVLGEIVYAETIPDSYIRKFVTNSLFVDLPAGIYLLQVKSDGFTGSARFIKE